MKTLLMLVPPACSYALNLHLERVAADRAAPDSALTSTEPTRLGSATMGGMAAERRKALGEFLRSRRERRRPEEVGFPVAGRRRTPGLRREEVAMLAGVSVTWYTWLEQGRDVRGSRQVLGSLVRVLGLDAVETAHVFELAGELPPRGNGAPPAEVPLHCQAMLDRLDPNPAFLIDRRFDVVAWNRGAEILYPDLPHVEPTRRNILRLTFTSQEVRAMSEDWEADAAQTVAFFRARLGQDVADPEIALLINELHAESDDFTRLWHRKDLAALASHTRAIHHPKLGRVTFELTKLRTLDDEQTLIAWLAPEGSELASQLADLIDDA
jgi:transcriptional regulator with XRE-family HTH domain